MPLRLVAHVLILVGSLTSTACASSPLRPDEVGADQSDQASRPAQTSTLTVSKVSPVSGPVGTTVTITGRGFGAKNNTATFGMGYIRNIESADGTTLTFVVPEGLDLCPPDSTSPCAGAHPRTKAGEYTISIMIDGKKSNALTFTVTP